eukprot:GHVL01003031.1.p1 GENE.GHVL01003031.1~~GHVL01003031.1.p1  ORF type:complete len:101 (+),score=31.86 GHVL01003031.1:405-707(+)
MLSQNILIDIDNILYKYKSNFGIYKIIYEKTSYWKDVMHSIFNILHVCEKIIKNENEYKYLLISNFKPKSEESKAIYDRIYKSASGKTIFMQKNTDQKCL